MTRKQVERIYILSAAGYSQSAIAAKLGYSIRTIHNVLKSGKVTKSALCEKLISQAHQELLEDAALIGEVKTYIARSIADDMAIANAIRIEAFNALEEIAADKTSDYAGKARALAAIATTLTVTQAVIRKALKIDESSLHEHSVLPQLTIRRMTDEETQLARKIAAGEVEELEGA